MEIETLLFGPAVDAAGTDRVTITLPERATAAEALAALAEQHPRLAQMVGFGRLAVNHEYAAPDQRLTPMDEVALISLVSGG
ncbi:MAG: MoaD/ThiS family protein [Phycisphaerales bacterium JB039]